MIGEGFSVWVYAWCFWNYSIRTTPCPLPPGLSPAYQMTARKPEPGTSTGSGWDLVWPTSIYPITQSYSACLVPHPTPLPTGLVTSVSCQTVSPVISVDRMTCRGSSSLMQPTLLLEVCRYFFFYTPVLIFHKPKVPSPYWLLNSPPALPFALVTFIL